MRQSDNDIVLYISDNYVGVPDCFDLREQETPGLTTIFTIIEHQLRGNVEFEINNGLSWRINFKDSLYIERI